MDKEVKEHVVSDENVLTEIGAAMALYGRRFILVVKDGVLLRSNLQGLYEVRYEGATLDENATIKLLEAINDMKKRPVASDIKAPAFQRGGSKAPLAEVYCATHPCLNIP